MKNFIIIINIIIVSSSFLNGQTKLSDTLVSSIYNQPYLKLKNMADCSLPMTTIEKRICANLEFQGVHTTLQELVSSITEDFKTNNLLNLNETFLQNQQEWIEQRNKEVQDINGKFDNMDLISKAHLETLTQLTIERIAILEEIMKS